MPLRDLNVLLPAWASDATFPATATMLRRLPHLRNTALADAAQGNRNITARQHPALLTHLPTRLLATAETRQESRDPGQVDVQVTGGRAGTPETKKTCVVVLITQRSQVQILPPLPSKCRSEA